MLKNGPTQDLLFQRREDLKQIIGLLWMEWRSLIGTDFNILKRSFIHPGSMTKYLTGFCLPCLFSITASLWCILKNDKFEMSIYHGS